MADMTTKDIILMALKEDMPNGDVTTESLSLDARPGIARLIAKQDLILSGRMVFEDTIWALDPAAKMTWYFGDSQKALKGQHLAMIEGDLIQILKAERVGLNLLGHLSGIATLTGLFVEQVRHTSTKILDTRKTMPMLRALEKKAVRDGGGVNHRQNLSDAIMIKDNHIRAAGSITEAIQRVRHNSDLPITVEVSNIEEVKEAAALKPHRLLLDNMDNETLKTALSLTPADIETEASGNMNVHRVKSVAELGVDFISVGQITHSAPTADISLLFEW